MNFWLTVGGLVAAIAIVLLAVGSYAQAKVKLYVEERKRRFLEYEMEFCFSRLNDNLLLMREQCRLAREVIDLIGNPDALLIIGPNLAECLMADCERLEHITMLQTEDLERARRRAALVKSI